MASYSWVSFSHERQNIKIPTPESHRAGALETVLGAILRRKYFRNFLPCPDRQRGASGAQQLHSGRMGSPEAKNSCVPPTHKLTHSLGTQVVLFRQVQQSHHGMPSIPEGWAARLYFFRTSSTKIFSISQFYCHFSIFYCSPTSPRLQFGSRV